MSSFFGPATKKKRDDENVQPQSDIPCSISEESLTSTSTPTITTPENKNISPQYANDVGHCIGKNVDDHTKKTLLEEPWMPPNVYSFPFSTRTVSEKEVKNYVSIKHLESHKEWLVLSDINRGLYCKYCPWFANRQEGGYQKNVPLGALVTRPLTNFKNLTGVNSDLEVHARNIYHKQAMISGKEFLKCYHNPQLEVSNLLDETHLSRVKENRERLIPIVKTIIFLGKQNIPLRGHRDDGPILTNCMPEKNEGNFRALLRFRVDAGDKCLENHLKTASSRATYISKTLQDQLIECCRVEILSKILKRVSESRYYSIIFDETPDLSGKAQVSVVIRYVDLNANPRIREDFVTFIDAFGELVKRPSIPVDQGSEDEDEDLEVHQNTRKETAQAEIEELSLTGVSLGQIVLKEMKDMKLPLENCVAVGTDGCAVMLGEHGAVKELQKEAKNACMTPCFSHKLNNSISKSSKVVLIERASGIIREVTLFFKISRPKRNTELAKFLGKKLVQLCETRWVERHDAVLQFIVSLPDIIEALTKISQWKNKDTAGKASVLISALSNFEFLIGLFCLGDILSLTQPLSVILQKETIDLAKASEIVKSLIATLEQRRREVDEHFNEIFENAKQMAEKLDIDVKRPRTCARQTRRENYALEDCQDYYRVSTFIPLIETVTEDLKVRFSQEVLDSFNLTLLIPDKVILQTFNQTKELIKSLISRFGNLLEGNKEIQVLKLKAEVQHWQQLWSTKKTSGDGLPLPASSFDALKSCDEDVYPIIHKLLQIFCTLPVTNASAERSFSSLRCIKTWLRTTILEKRLCGLALLHIHYDIDIKPEEVVERFSKIGQHRILI